MAPTQLRPCKLMRQNSIRMILEGENTSREQTQQQQQTLEPFQFGLLYFYAFKNLNKQSSSSLFVHAMLT